MSKEDKIKEELKEKLFVGKKGEQVFQPVALSELIRKTLTIKTMADNGEVWIYNEQDGLYHKTTSPIKQWAKKYLGWSFRKSRVDSTLYDIKTVTEIKREDFKHSRDFIPVINGVIDISSEPAVRIDYTPEMNFTFKYPIIHNPEAKCPVINEFLLTVAGRKNSQKLKEFIAYLFEDSYFIQKAFMIYGEADRGKTTFVLMLNTFLGEKNISYEPLQDLCHDKFSMAQLYGKIANISDDLTQRELKDAGNFKRLTGQSPCKGQFKNEDPFYFHNKSKQLYTINKMLKTKDLTDAFFKRWEMVPFLIQFFHDREPYIIPNYFHQLTTEEELSGLLNDSIKNLKRLRDQGHFTNSSSIEENRQFWRILAEPVFGFTNEMCTIKSTKWIDRDIFFLDISKYLREHGIPALSSNMVTRKMKERFALVRKGAKSKQKWCWQGITLNRLLKKGEKEELTRKKKKGFFS